MSDPYRPGQYNSPDQTTRIPRVTSHPAPPQRRAPEPGNNKTREYVLKGLGLVGVAVVSGMLWWLIQQSGNAPDTSSLSTSTPQPTTKFKFVKHEQVAEPVRDSNCARVSYSKVQDFFEKKPCTEVIRELYTTNVDGKKVFSSVAVVRMSSSADAAELKKLTETNGTGNVNDLVKDGRVKVAGLASLGNGAFAAKISGNDVIIVESDIEGGSKKGDDAKLEEISTDALAFGEQLKKTS
ncbi:hypothetical protein LWC34_33080 [Kibdelosporangium philippinense]|uniref:Uncharacterized protein n=1 Tax=Kibdelosporangium philippinense TaxID=211113 RepID=A0ABS8ZII5_9PSEU|nr:hypothetical protein [Kibdelosporangium philippinense]MCE7007621.1 hypothetical protein [Kibdelosporangium philippinense]